MAIRHTLNLEVKNLAREKNIVLLCLPPHCSHRLQPLDVSFMKPLMTFYSQEVQKWLRNHPGRIVTMFQIGERFGEAYLRAATMKTARNSFQSTGIYPCNRNVFSEPDFVASLTTDVPLTVPPIEPSQGEVCVEEPVAAAPLGNNGLQSLHVGLPMNEVLELLEAVIAPSTKAQGTSTRFPDTETQMFIEEQIPDCLTEQKLVQTNDVIPKPSSSHVPITTVSPLPKSQREKSSRGSCARGQTVAARPVQTSES